jgi:hypothetical protein
MFAIMTFIKKREREKKNSLIKRDERIDYIMKIK